ncbi:MAG: DUF2203 family protein [Ignavibacteriaceae bacterium]|nr:DUF2203 family protein [Ignavibacteriaceae bacterium]
MTTDVKYFTPAEAKKTLPLVRKIVKDILDTSREMRLIADEIGRNVENDPAFKSLQTISKDLCRNLKRIGCYFKDWNFSIGLIDFPAIIDGKEASPLLEK